MDGGHKVYLIFFFWKKLTLQICVDPYLTHLHIRHLLLNFRKFENRKGVLGIIQSCNERRLGYG